MCHKDAIPYALTDDFKNINKWIWEDPDPEHEFGCFLCLDTEEFYPSLIKKTFLWESFNIYKGE